MYRQIWLALAIAAGCAVVPVAVAAQSQASAVGAANAITSAADVEAFTQQYCVACHNERNKAAVRDLALDAVDVTAVGQHGDIWEKVVRKLRAGQMPPLTARRPERALSDQVATWLEAELDRAAEARPNPGRKASLHRLNRFEYKNAVRDLLGLDVNVEDLLPPDPLGGGDANFDNIASSLRISRSLLEQYLVAARKVSRVAMSGKVPSTIEVFRVPQGLRQDIRLDGMPFGTRGGFAFDYIFPVDGLYEFVVSTGGLGAGIDADMDGERLELSIDGERAHEWTLQPLDGAFVGGGADLRRRPEPPTVRVPIRAGAQRVMATFTKIKPLVEYAGDRVPFARTGRYGTGSGNKFPTGVAQIVLTGPLQVTGKSDTASRRKILTCTPRSAAEEEPCAREILTTLARSGLRRQATEDDLAFLLQFYEEGHSESDFDGGIQRAIRALLVMPDFLFRIEADPAGVAPGAPYRISDLELASRLSFFLWSSVPDDELLDVAVKGQLKTPAVLEEQVRRMLQDPRSDALTQGFASFYLWIRNVAEQQFDSDAFPNFDQTLREAMAKETELFFDSVRVEDRSILTLLDADYTFVNERLALHYEIPNVRGSDFRRVVLPADSPRRGILGKASILATTSEPKRTSPVRRGKWILDNVLGTPPPPPPPNVPLLGEEQQDDGRILTMRELMAKHRSNPVCAGCHRVIDPMGFALEQFDATGKWRDVDRSFTRIDPAGTTPDGSTFANLADFRGLLISNPGPFLRTFTEKLLVYALGRPYESYDAPAGRTILRDAAPENYTFSSVVLGIVKSAPFQMRLAADAPTVAAQ